MYSKTINTKEFNKLPENSKLDYFIPPFTPRPSVPEKFGVYIKIIHNKAAKPLGHQHNRRASWATIFDEFSADMCRFTSSITVNESSPSYVVHDFWIAGIGILLQGTCQKALESLSSRHCCWALLPLLDLVTK